MNKARRTALAKALPLIAQAQAILLEAKAVIESVRDDEQEVYDNMSEGAQAGDNGETMQAAITDMEEAIDGISSIELKDVADAIERVADVTGAEVVPAKLTQAETEARRMERLPEWAKQRIAAAERKAAEADARLADVFPEVEEGNKRQITIDDYMSPVRGRVVPSDQVAFPGHGIRVSADRHGRGVSIDGLEMGSLSVLPQAGNSVIIRVVRDF